MITVTRVTVYDSENHHFTTKVSDEHHSYKDAVKFYKEKLSSGEFKVKTVRMDYDEEEEIDDLKLRERDLVRFLKKIYGV